MPAIRRAARRRRRSAGDAAATAAVGARWQRARQRRPPPCLPAGVARCRDRPAPVQAPAPTPPRPRQALPRPPMPPRRGAAGAARAVHAAPASAAARPARATAGGASGSIVRTYATSIRFGIACAASNSLMRSASSRVAQQVRDHDHDQHAGPGDAAADRVAVRRACAGVQLPIHASRRRRAAASAFSVGLSCTTPASAAASEPMAIGTLSTRWSRPTRSVVAPVLRHHPRRLVEAAQPPAVDGEQLVARRRRRRARRRCRAARA